MSAPTPVDAERQAVHARLARYAARRRRLEAEQPTPWLDRRVDDLLDRLLELRGVSGAG